MNKDKEKIYKPCKHEKSCREGNMLICSDCPHGIYDLEKGIDIIEDFIENHLERDKLEINEGRGGFKIGQIYKITELNPALSHLLTEYKNLKQENKELKKQNKKNKQKIMDKIEENREKAQKYINQKEYNQADIKLNYITALQDLLEEVIKDEK